MSADDGTPADDDPTPGAREGGTRRSTDSTFSTGDRTRTGGLPVTGPLDVSGGVTGRVAVLGVVVGLFALAVVTSRVLRALTATTVGVGDPGTVSRLLVGVVGLQVVGFGAALALVVRYHERPLSYLRVGSLDWWTAFHGAAVGLALMILTSAVTVVFRLFALEPPAGTAAVTPDPLFYVVLFLVSTAVAVPMEELFFRGVVQRSLTAAWHPVVGVGVASLLFVGIHTGIQVDTGGELLVAAMFFGFGVVLGVGYHVTRNLFVPVVGHAIFNGAQILTQALDVTV